MFGATSNSGQTKDVFEDTQKKKKKSCKIINLVSNKIDQNHHCNNPSTNPILGNWSLTYPNPWKLTHLHPTISLSLPIKPKHFLSFSKPYFPLPIRSFTMSVSICDWIILLIYETTIKIPWWKKKKNLLLCLLTIKLTSFNLSHFD